VVQLRPYQNQKIKEIYDAWQNHRSVMLQMPTGTGKTVLFNQIVKDELANNSKVLIIAHRKELIDQNVARLWNDFGIRAGTIMANIRADLSLPVQVASIQTLSNKNNKNKQEYLDFKPSTVIIDEAHHVPAKSYRELWEIYTDSKFLGVTATPIRLSGEGFKDLFDVLILSNSINEFIQDGYLAKIKYIGRSPILPKLDLSSIAIIGGDYDSEQLSQKMCEEAVMANLIKSYLDHAKGKKMIVFAVTTDHSKSITERYQSAGFEAAHIDSDTPQKERNEIINKFRSGEIRILSNVGIISEGFDVPDCEVVQLARPTKSLVMYLQQVGRCMRPSRNKPYSIVLDNVGLYDEFGSPKNHRDWSLDASPKDKPDNIDGDGNERLAREPLEEIDEALVIERKTYKNQ
jgi:superfamily II DNA or RNA helicase